MEKAQEALQGGGHTLDCKASDEKGKELRQRKRQGSDEEQTVTNQGKLV